jgi:FkbM family methyltransferase
MLFNFRDLLKLSNKKINGVLHIGAHEGQEREEYLNNNINKIIFVEANKNIFEKLNKNCVNYEKIKTFNFAVSDKDGEKVNFYVTSNESASSSILKLKKHSDEYPDIVVEEIQKVETITIDTLLKNNNINFSDYNMLNMDIQGAELLALKGASEYLKKCDVIYTEVNFDELYENCGLIEDIENHIKKIGFKRVKMFDTGRRWGDALYVKE